MDQHRRDDNDLHDDSSFVSFPQKIVNKNIFHSGGGGVIVVIH